MNVCAVVVSEQIAPEAPGTNARSLQQPVYGVSTKVSGKTKED